MATLHGTVAFAQRNAVAEVVGEHLHLHMSWTQHQFFQIHFVVAKRGTRFHQWLEDRFGATALLDEDQLPGMDENLEDAATFEELRTAFSASDWAARTPTYVEHPFEVVIGGHVIRGRMDAVFREPDGSWLVVDWKTGRTPTGPEMDAAVIQLAVYRIAWAQLQKVDPAQVRGAFHYVAPDHTFEPPSLPDAGELAGLLERP